MGESVIAVTEAAARHIQQVLNEKQWSGYGLRFGLQDGGCSGYSYLFEFEPAPAAEDLVHEEHGVKIFIHPMHVPFVAGTTLNYKEDKFQSAFDVQNPNAKRFCGCGESFDVG